MDISKLKTVTLNGPEDGHEIAFIVDKTAYIVRTHGMSEALFRMKREFGIQTHEWMLSCDKAVLIPGIWEYQMAVCIKGMNEDQVADLADQLKLNAEAA
jgi:hypothetical protein